MRLLADHAADALLTEGPAHPDRQLLDACEQALRLLTDALDLYEQAHARFRAGTSWTDADRTWHSETTSAARAAEVRATHILRTMKKVPAKTAAGVYAKALVVRASATGAGHLARSLAEDLLANPTLRASLWPAEVA